MPKYKVHKKKKDAPYDKEGHRSSWKKKKHHGDDDDDDEGVVNKNDDAAMMESGEEDGGEEDRGGNHRGGRGGGGQPRDRHRGGDGGGGGGDHHRRRKDKRGGGGGHRHHHHGGGGGGNNDAAAAAMNDDTTPCNSFDEMNLKPDLLKGIYAYGFEKPSAIQQRAIRPIIRGRDVIAQSQSGTGKTAVFSIAALQLLQESSRDTQVLVLSPTRELAEQTQRVMQSLGDFMNVSNATICFSVCCS